MQDWDASLGVVRKERYAAFARLSQEGFPHESIPRECLLRPHALTVPQEHLHDLDVAREPLPRERLGESNVIIPRERPDVPSVMIPRERLPSFHGHPPRTHIAQFPTQISESSHNNLLGTPNQHRSSRRGEYSS